LNNSPLANGRFHQPGQLLFGRLSVAFVFISRFKPHLLLNSSTKYSDKIGDDVMPVERIPATVIIPGCPYYDHIVEIKGSINLESQFDALKAYNAISNKCYDLHKGADGISKTWKQVDVHVKALVINTSYNSIRQEDSNAVDRYGDKVRLISIEEIFARHD